MSLRIGEATGRATCRTCLKTIEKGDLEVVGNLGTGNYEGHYHLRPCFLKANLEFLSRLWWKLTDEEIEEIAGRNPWE